ncbi:MAG: hypothetical protein NTU98_03960 [Bacteroidetes bacterium]|nr:hypothetical protein [Bacteroidota bacterium]
MNPKSKISRIFILGGLGLALTIFITRPVFSQDATKTNGEKKVTIVAKIIEDKDGKKKVFDTTITLNRGLKPGEEEEMLKNLKLRYKDLGDEMKEMEMQLSEMDLPDSGMMDSIHRFTVRCLRDCNKMGFGHCNKQMLPYGFNYDFDFDMPDFSDFQPPMIREFNDERGGGQTLNDVLGDISMDNVKSYSVKETKDGKKIIIELKKDPIVEHHQEVIIMRAPGYQRGHGHDAQPQIRKKIIIKSGDDDDGEKL